MNHPGEFQAIDASAPANSHDPADRIEVARCTEREIPATRLTDAERLELRRQIAGGASHAAAAEAVHCSTKTVQLLLVRSGGLAPRDRPRALLRLSPGEREEISRGLQAGDRPAPSPAASAFVLDVSREVIRKDELNTNGQTLIASLSGASRRRPTGRAPEAVRSIT